MKPGSLVICVDDTHWSSFAKEDFPSLPVKDSIYTVRRIIPNIDEPDGPPGVALEEIRGVWDHFETYFGTTVYEECHFKMSRFKEVLPPNQASEEIIVEKVLESNQCI